MKKSILLIVASCRLPSKGKNKPLRRIRPLQHTTTQSVSRFYMGMGREGGKIGIDDDDAMPVESWDMIQICCESYMDSKKSLWYFFCSRIPWIGCHHQHRRRLRSGSRCLFHPLKQQEEHH